MKKWKDIPEYEGLYQASTSGNIRNNRNRFLKATLTNGYLKVTLFKFKIKKSIRVHRLIGFTFIPNPENKPFINHKNGNKLDNRKVNLEWNTRSENIKHAWDTKLITYTGKLNKIVIQYTKTRKKVREYESLSMAAKLSNLDKGSIGKCCLKYPHFKTAGGFIWEYKK